MQKTMLKELLIRLTEKFLVKKGCVHRTIKALTGFVVSVALTIALFVILIMNFEYEIEGDAEDKPTMVFDNGIRTVIKYDKLPKEPPKIFITKDDEGQSLSLMTGGRYYKVKYNSYIMDEVADEFEIVGSDKKIIKISRGKSCAERVIEKIEEKIYS